jgi:hypothetical protein
MSPKLVAGGLMEGMDLTAGGGWGVPRGFRSAEEIDLVTSLPQPGTQPPEVALLARQSRNGSNVNPDSHRGPRWLPAGFA